MDGVVVALSGDLGSGKSSVSEKLARALGARRVSTGEAQRHIAEQRGISTLELNRLAETDPTIDDEVDSVFRSLASGREALVVDSRLAWHFLPGAFKVHLVVDPAEAASRVLHRPGAHAEHYRSLPEALAKMGERVESERRRFQAVYGIDIFRLDNYDLVVDTTEASPVEVADRVLDRLPDPAGPAASAGPAAPAGAPGAARGPALLIAPARVRPAPVGPATAGPAAVDPVPAGDRPDLGTLIDEVGRYGFSRLPPVTVAYDRPTFSVLDGADRLEAARRCGLALVPAVLGAEAA